MVEEQELLEKLGRYLHLGRKGLIGYVFLLPILPVQIIALIASLQKLDKWYWSIPILLLWMIGIWVQSRGIRKRNKVCGEILNLKNSTEKGSPRLRKMLSASKLEISLLLSLILSPFAFVAAFKFFREYKVLSKDYEVEWGEKVVGNRMIPITYKKGI